MAKSAYIGVDGIARKVKKMYVGVDGKARKVKKGYVGVGGAARPFFLSGGETLVYYGKATSLSRTGYNYASANVGNYVLFAGSGLYPIRLTRHSPRTKQSRRLKRL